LARSARQFINNQSAQAKVPQVTGDRSVAGTLIVRYTGVTRSAHLVKIALVAMVLFALLFAYQDEDLRQLLSKHRSREPASVWGVALLSVLAIAPLADLVLTSRLTRQGQLALMIDRDGVEGRIFYRRSKLAWSQIERVARTSGNLVVVPVRSGVAKAWAALPSRFGPDNAANAIYLPLAALDTGAEEILAAVRTFAPDKL